MKRQPPTPTPANQDTRSPVSGEPASPSIHQSPHPLIRTSADAPSRRDPPLLVCSSFPRVQRIPRLPPKCVRHTQTAKLYKKFIVALPPSEKLSKPVHLCRLSAHFSHFALWPQNLVGQLSIKHLRHFLFPILDHFFKFHACELGL